MITEQDLIEEKAKHLKPGPLFSKHLKCPHCDSWFSSTASRRTHVMTKHPDEYNADRKKRGYPPIARFPTGKRLKLPDPVAPPDFEEKNKEYVL